MIGVALQLYSVRDDFKKDFRGTLKAVAEMGYEGVEFAGPMFVDADQIKAALDEFGLQAVGWHIGIDHLQGDKLEETVNIAKTVGISRLVVPGLPEEYTADNWTPAARALQQVSEALKPYGLKTGYHNHFTEFTPADNSPWDNIFSNTDSGVIMQLDTGNALKGGGDILGIMKKFPGRAETVHLKPWSSETEFVTVLGEDSTPWEDFFHLCKTIGDTQWYIVEYEVEDLYKPLDGVKVCLDNFLKFREADKA